MRQNCKWLFWRKTNEKLSEIFVEFGINNNEITLSFEKNEEEYEENFIVLDKEDLDSLKNTSWLTKSIWESKLLDYFFTATTGSASGKPICVHWALNCHDGENGNKVRVEHTSKILSKWECDWEVDKNSDYDVDPKFFAPMNSIKFIEERTESNDQEEAMEIFRKALHDVFKDKNNDNKDNVNEEIENEIILFAFGYLSENFISIVFR